MNIAQHVVWLCGITAHYPRTKSLLLDINVLLRFYVKEQKTSKQVRSVGSDWYILLVNLVSKCKIHIKCEINDFTEETIDEHHLHIRCIIRIYHTQLLT